MIPPSGESQVSARVQNSAGTRSGGTLGVLASRHQPGSPNGSDSWQVAALIYNSDDNRTSNASDDVTVSLTGLAAQMGMFPRSLCCVCWGAGKWGSCCYLLLSASRSPLRHLLLGQQGQQPVPAVAGPGPTRLPHGPTVPTPEERPGSKRRHEAAVTTAETL